MYLKRRKEWNRMDGMVEVCFMLLEGWVFIEKLRHSQPHDEGNEEARCYMLTTVRDIHHRLTMVWAGASFFCSSSLPRAWQLMGIRGDKKYTYIGSHAE